MFVKAAWKLYNTSMIVWDYDKKTLEKSEKGRILLLERMINYGPGKEKIKLDDVKKYWGQLHLFTLSKRLFELLIWGKYSSPPSKKSSWMR